VRYQLRYIPIARKRVQLWCKPRAEKKLCAEVQPTIAGGFLKPGAKLQHFFELRALLARKIC
jgi:hypothetical protein